MKRKKIGIAIILGLFILLLFSDCLYAKERDFYNILESGGKKDAVSVEINHFNPFSVCIDSVGSLIRAREYRTRKDFLLSFGIKESKKMWTIDYPEKKMFCIAGDKVFFGYSVIDVFLKYYGYL